jgi:hypothetical protein
MIPSALYVRNRHQRGRGHLRDVVTNRYAFRAISSLVETKVGSERTGVDSLFLATRLIPRLHTDIFRSTEDTTFPGFDKPVPKGQIICSCPITQSKPGEDAQSYQILGPHPCDKSFFGYCKATTATSKTGSTIYVGAPAGTAQGLAVLLNGKVPPVNECKE